MLSLDDPRWANLTGGYKVLFDPRPLLVQLQTTRDTAKIWLTLWEELHHQGDVGEASYAAVPQLVRIYRNRGVVDWNTYAIVAIIESARTERQNPRIPEWLEEEYFCAIRELAETGATEIFKAEDMDTVRAILSEIAIARGLRAHARLLINYTDDELLDLEYR